MLPQRCWFSGISRFYGWTSSCSILYQCLAEVSIVSVLPVLRYIHPNHQSITVYKSLGFRVTYKKSTTNLHKSLFSLPTSEAKSIQDGRCLKSKPPDGCIKFVPRFVTYMNVTFATWPKIIVQNGPRFLKLDGPLAF